MELPHSRCNWLNEYILVGAVPIEKTLQPLLDIGIVKFICLSSRKECWYFDQVGPSINCQLITVPSGKAPSLKILSALVDELMTDQRKTYIHCVGGHGRTGVVAAAYYGKMYGLSTSDAIDRVEISRNTRQDTSRNFIPTPETSLQVTRVAQFLKSWDSLPDRSDMRWVKKVRENRMTNSAIYFYTDSQLYSEFSNYYKHKTPLIFNNKTYATAEHLFQSLKFDYDEASQLSKEYAEIIRTASTPNIARELAGQKIKGGYPWRTKLNPIINQYKEVKMRSDWNQIRVDIMKIVLQVKFNQDEYCQQLLLSTRNKLLIENTKRDNFWGNGSDGNGQNHLGKLLVEIRTLFQQSL